MPDLSESEAEARAQRLVRMRDRLVGCGLSDEAVAFLETAASAGSEPDFALIERQVEIECAKSEKAKPPRLMTFRDACDAWVNGDFHTRFPSRVPPMGDERRDQVRARLLHICKTIGDRPLSKLSKGDCERALTALPKGLRDSTLSEYARLIPRVLDLAVLGDHIERSPLPPKWAPGRGIRREFQLLYPSEDANLMRCTILAWERRLLWGFLVRTGCRVSEALRLTWSDIDLEAGTIVIRRTKTKKMRRWRLEEDVRRALSAYQKRTGSGGNERLWPWRRAGIALKLREDLQRCKLVRRELHESTEESRNLTVHDLRGSAVTIWLATNKPIPWIKRRSGHAQTKMIDVYQRAVDYALEHQLGEYGPLDELLGVGQARARRGKTSQETGSDPSASPTGKGDERGKSPADSGVLESPSGSETDAGPGLDDEVGRLENLDPRASSQRGREPLLDTLADPSPADETSNVGAESRSRTHSERPSSPRHVEGGRESGPGEKTTTKGAGEPGNAAAGEVRRTSGPPSDDPQRARQLAPAPAPADLYAQAIADLALSIRRASEAGHWDLAGRLLTELEALRAERNGGHA